MSNERTEISSLGEFGLIDHLTQNNETKLASTILSVGDDAAVIDHFGKQTVITTDMLVEGIHFDLMYTPLKHLGYKSVVVNLSDIYAMNAIPTHVTLSIAFSNRFSLEAMDEFYEGVYAACEKYEVDLVGGDTTSSQKGFVICKKKYCTKRRFIMCEWFCRRRIFRLNNFGKRKKNFHRYRFSARS